VVDVDTERLTVPQIESVDRWTRDIHRAVAGFTHRGPWRYFPIEGAAFIGHNDIAPYNVCFDGDELVGVFDWDVAGPTNALAELAFIAWNCVPMWFDIGPDLAAERLRVIADTYGAHPAAQILAALPARIQVMLDGIPVRAAAGDAGMANLMAQGEPERSAASLADLVTRIPAVERALARLGG
jgi:hypothetical protein